MIREINAEGQPRKTITTTKVDVGDLKLLDRAVKFAVASAKLAAPTLSQHVVWEEEGEARDAGGEAREDAGLLAEVVHLVEAPTALRGTFEEAHLALPREVLVTVYRSTVAGSDESVTSSGMNGENASSSTVTGRASSA